MSVHPSIGWSVHRSHQKTYYVVQHLPKCPCDHHYHFPYRMPPRLPIIRPRSTSGNTKSVSPSLPPGTRGFQPKNAGTNWGWHKFMSHDLLFDSNKGYLHDDKLIIMSEVSMLASVTASTGVIPAPPSTLAEDLAAIQYGLETLSVKGPRNKRIIFRREQYNSTGKIPIYEK